MRSSKTTIMQRFVELRDLQDEWLDGEGVAPGSGILEWAEVLTRQICDRFPGGLGIFPTEEGGVQLEWSRTEVEVRADRTIVGRCVELPEEQDLHGTRRFSELLEWLSTAAKANNGRL